MQQVEEFPGVLVATRLPVLTVPGTYAVLRRGRVLVETLSRWEAGNLAWRRGDGAVAYDWQGEEV